MYEDLELVFVINKRSWQLVASNQLSLGDACFCNRLRKRMGWDMRDCTGGVRLRSKELRFMSGSLQGTKRAASAACFREECANMFQLQPRCDAGDLESRVCRVPASAFQDALQGRRGPQGNDASRATREAFFQSSDEPPELLQMITDMLGHDDVIETVRDGRVVVQDLPHVALSQACFVVNETFQEVAVGNVHGSEGEIDICEGLLLTSHFMLLADNGWSIPDCKGGSLRKDWDSGSYDEKIQKVGKGSGTINGIRKAVETGLMEASNEGYKNTIKKVLNKAEFSDAELEAVFQCARRGGGVMRL